MKKTGLILLCAIFLFPVAAFSQQVENKVAQHRFSCGEKVTHDLDGKEYNTLLIGGQCWMKENLNAGRLIDISKAQADNGVIEKYCYDNLEENCSVYGGLYQWNEVMQYTLDSRAQGVCPQGWHIPSDGDWNQLINFLGGDVAAGGKMKEAGTTHFLEPNIGATNQSGFKALPGGYSYATGGFYFNNLKKVGYYWSSTPENETDVWFRSLGYGNEKISRHINYKSTGASVRCLQDDKP